MQHHLGSVVICLPRGTYLRRPKAGRARRLPEAAAAWLVGDLVGKGAVRLSKVGNRSVDQKAAWEKGDRSIDRGGVAMGPAPAVTCEGSITGSGSRGNRTTRAGSRHGPTASPTFSMAPQEGKTQQASKKGRIGDDDAGTRPPVAPGPFPCFSFCLPPGRRINELGAPTSSALQVARWTDLCYVL